jgi:hypothetical protein
MYEKRREQGRRDKIQQQIQPLPGLQGQVSKKTGRKIYNK